MLILIKTIPLAKRNKGTHLGALNDNYLTQFLLYFDLQIF